MPYDLHSGSVGMDQRAAPRSAVTACARRARASARRTGVLVGSGQGNTDVTDSSLGRSELYPLDNLCRCQTIAPARAGVLVVSWALGSIDLRARPFLGHYTNDPPGLAGGSLDDGRVSAFHAGATVDVTNLLLGRHGGHPTTRGYADARW